MRDPTATAAARWGEDARIAALVDGADLIVNLAGKSVGCRYDDANRNEIYRARIVTTGALHRAVTEAATPPRLWLNASTATIYRHATDRPQNETDGEIRHQPPPDGRAEPAVLVGSGFTFAWPELEPAIEDLIGR